MEELISCALDEITQQDKCNDRGGIRVVYWTEFANINLVALNATEFFDEATETIIGYPPLLNNGVFTKVSFEPLTSFYNFNYTRENDYYENLITLGFKGKSSDRRMKLQRAIACCNIWLHIFSNDGTSRVVAVDYNGVNFVQQVEGLSITRHDDNGGQLGSSRATDALDLVQSLCMLHYSQLLPRRISL